ncbi:MAG: imidazole glycerol phosphate synthase subunit HisH [Patescibacteria group bacterium]
MTATGNPRHLERPRRVHIVDAGLGNLRSVWHALAAVGAEPIVISEPQDLDGSARVILPGVGAFGDAMGSLRDGGWVSAIRRTVDENIPLLGICLGMQLLMTEGTEHGAHAGLDLVAGTVTQLRPGDPTLRLPHIGWNDIRPVRSCDLLADIADHDFYFVHSFAVAPEDPGVITSYCEHGSDFVATLHSGSVYGAQFHPEKSHVSGLQLLRNFIEMDGEGEC